MKRFFALAILLLALLPLEARKPIKVACIGDSITYGSKLENRE